MMDWELKNPQNDDDDEKLKAVESQGIGTIKLMCSFIHCSCE